MWSTTAIDFIDTKVTASGQTDWRLKWPHWRLMPILVACALDCDPRNFLNMGVMFSGKRALAAQIGMRGGFKSQGASMA